MHTHTQKREGRRRNAHEKILEENHSWQFEKCEKSMDFYAVKQREYVSGRTSLISNNHNLNVICLFYAMSETHVELKRKSRQHVSVFI